MLEGRYACKLLSDMNERCFGIDMNCIQVYPGVCFMYDMTSMLHIDV